MRTLREVAQFVNQPPPVGLRKPSEYLIPTGAPVSLRNLIQKLQALPPVVWQASVTPTEGTVSFFVVARMKPISGLGFNRHWRVLRDGQEVATLPSGGPNGQQYRVDVAGEYTFDAISMGIDGTGYHEEVRSFPVHAWAPHGYPGTLAPPATTNRLTVRVTMSPLVVAVDATITVTGPAGYSEEQKGAVNTDNFPNSLEFAFTLPQPASGSAAYYVTCEATCAAGVDGSLASGPVRTAAPIQVYFTTENRLVWINIHSEGATLVLTYDDFG